MAQQINLYTPILLRPRQHFSARAMAQSLGLLALVLTGFCAWAQWQLLARARDHAQQRDWLAAEQQQLTQALDTARARNDPAQLQRELARVQADTLALRQELAAAEHNWLRPGQAHSDMLALMARTIPPAAWMTRLHITPSQLQINGLTLDPSALRAWISQLSSEPLLAGQPVAQVRVEQLPAPLDASTLSASPNNLANLAPGASDESPLRSQGLPGGTPAWAFRLSAWRDAAQPPSPASTPPAAQAATAAVPAGRPSSAPVAGNTP